MKSAVDPAALKQAPREPKPWKPQGSKSLKFFQKWLKDLSEKVSLPQFDGTQLAEASKAVQSAGQVQKDALKILEKMKNRKGEKASQDELDAAKDALRDAEKAVEDAMTACQGVAEPILDQLNDFLGDTHNDDDLVTFTVLNQATPKALAQWCDQSEGRSQQLMAALKDTDFLRLCLESGGARNGCYGRAVEVYHQIRPDDPVLKRLALAVSLELADPYKLFDKIGHTDALQRYVHYEQAYTNGELDPAFSQFNVWEMRHVVDSDADEATLAWGRESLLTYRPDIAILDNNQWRYCKIVKSDVNYNTPDWYKEPRSYDQILSGGGKCGPRAWYGRFIAKAFGIPTWGVRQPGHAAMGRWTPTGWVPLLGGGMWKSWWEDQGGTDFVLETLARSVCGSENVFREKVLRLQWASAFCRESTKTVMRDYLADANSPWLTLGLMQRRRLTKEKAFKPMFKRQPTQKNRIVQLRTAGKPKHRKLITVENDGVIFIPAVNCTSPKKTNQKTTFMPSFSGGQQLFVSKDGQVDYTIASKDVQTKQYKLTMLVSTAHRKELPVLVKVAGGMEVSVPLPYTMGLWKESKPVSIDLPAGVDVNLSVIRTKHMFGFAFKEMKLTPV